MPVGVPHIVCSGCGRAASLWMPLCPLCQSIADDELSPVIGERYRDTLRDTARAATTEE